MGKLTDFLLGSSDERKKKHGRHDKQKKELLKQKEGNKKMRAFYRKRNKDEINLRTVRVPKHKVKSKAENNLRRWGSMEDATEKLKKLMKSRKKKKLIYKQKNKKSGTRSIS